MAGSISGIPRPAMGSAPSPTRERTPSGRYSMRAPEEPAGGIVYALPVDGLPRALELVELENGFRVFVDVDREFVDVKRWRDATPEEADGFMRDRKVRQWADYADEHGALALAKKLAGLSRLDLEAALFSTALELQRRERRGKADQVFAIRTAQGDE